MTQSPNSNPEPPRHRSGRRQMLTRVVLVGGGVLLVGTVAAGWWAWQFINHQLAPLVSQNLSKTFNRPVEVGPVEGVTLNQLTFGESRIPATPTDSDRGTIESVQVRFNLLELLWDRTLSLDVTLVRPNVYLEQDENGVWIATQIGGDQEEEPGPVTIELDTLRIQDGTAQLAAYGEVETSAPVETEPGAEPPQDEDAPATLPREQAVNTVIGLQNINGRVTFRNDNQLIGYDITAEPETGGTLAVAGTTNLEAEETTLKVTSRDLLAPDVSLLVPLPLKLQAGRLASDLEIAFLPNNQPLQFNGTVRFQNIRASLDGAPQPFSQINGGLRFQGQRIAFQDFRGQYGAIPARVSGSLDTQGEYDLQVRVPRATVPNILETLELEESALPLQVAGAFTAQFDVAGPINQPQISGTVRNLAAVQIDRVQFARTEATFNVTPQAVVVNQFRAVPVDGGLVTARGRVALGEQAGVVVDVAANNLPGDSIAAAYGANTGNVQIGRVDATAQVIGPLNAIQTVVQWQAPQATYPGRGRIVIAGSDINFEDTAVLVAGGIVRGNGRISQGRWQAVLDTAGIELSQFSSELRGLFSGNFRLAGSLDNFDLAAIEAEGEGRFSEGLAIIRDPLTASVRWLGDRLQIVEASARNFRADGFILTRLEGTPAVEALDLNVALQNYRLTDLPATIPPQIRLAGTTDFNGSITGPLNAITVAGQLGLNNFAVNTFQFEPRLSGEVRYALNRGLSLDLNGERDRIAVVLDDRNRPRSFYVRQADTVAEGRGNGDRLLASLRNFPLTALNLAPVENAGLVSGNLNGQFDINIADLSNPAVIGEVAIVNPALGYISAEALPAARLGDENCLVPDSNLISQTEQTALFQSCAKSLFTGRFRYVNRVAVLEEGSQLQLGRSRYLLSGTYNPGVDPQFRGRVVADEGRVEEIFAVLRWFELGDLGRLQPPDYATAAAVDPIGIDVSEATLLNRLRRYSEIRALRRQQVIAREESSLFPELSTLQGPFRGSIDLAYSGSTGSAVDFDLGGENWQWGECPTVDPTATVPITYTDRCQRYQVNQVVARGSFRDGVLTLLPVSLTSDESEFSITGQIGGPNQSAQVIARNIPVAPLRDLFELPLNLDGNLNATAQLGGSIENPQFEGAIDLTEATVDQTKPIPPLRSTFGYTNARLTFFTRIIPPPETPVAPPLDPPSPDTIAEIPAVPSASPIPPSPTPPSPTLTASDVFRFDGSIPYQLPFASVAPDSYQVSVDLDIRNNGLSLINLFTDLVAWRGGEGDVQLQVRGNLPPDQFDLRSLTASGQAEFVNAQIGSSALPQDLTNVNGNIFFEQDQIRVESVVGQFGNGQVTADGIIPLLFAFSETDPGAARPLVVGLNGLSLELPDLYEGDVNGRVLVTGAALAPQIGGNIALSNGRITIAGREAEVPTATPVTNGTTDAAPTAQRNGNFTPPEYVDLRVTLGDRLRVTYDPVVNFLVQGDLLVSGTQADPLLDGTVRLRSGQVNLFTTQFNLDRGHRNVAVFELGRGLDPLIDVRLVTSIPEVTRYPDQTNSPFPVSEIVDTSPSAGDFGAIQTVRVQASVVGPASQLFNNLELTSSPSRSETEILALLGGGFIGNVQGNATTALASIAGSPLLTGIQNLVNDTFGISDFRLFPTTILSSESRTTLALAAELGVDITNDLSVSVLQLLTVSEQPQFSLRYRLTDEILLRGSTNFSDESRAVIEFETRF